MDRQARWATRFDIYCFGARVFSGWKRTQFSPERSARALRPFDRNVTHFVFAAMHSTAHTAQKPARRAHVREKFNMERRFLSVCVCVCLLPHSVHVHARVCVCVMDGRPNYLEFVCAVVVRARPRPIRFNVRAIATTTTSHGVFV